MTHPAQDFLANAVKCKELMSDYVCQVERQDYAEFEPARASVIAQPVLANHIPDILWKCRTLSDCWDILKPMYRHYVERRTYLREQFDPLLTWLEREQTQEYETDESLPFRCSEDEFFSKVVQLLMARGREREVAVFTAASKLSLRYYDETAEDGTPWTIQIGLSLPLYEQLDANQRKDCQTTITRTAQELPRTTNDWIISTSIIVEVQPNPDWRDAALTWLRGEGINNQGRVRSDNLPTREVDGLLFRSQPEIHLYRALKAKGVVFAPLAVFLHGGDTYERVEPDFLVFRDGAVMLVEVDGDTFHIESPAEADQRTRMFKLQGAYIERVKASECDTPEKATATALRILVDFKNWRGTR